jgi:hypothetical protein
MLSKRHFLRDEQVIAELNVVLWTCCKPERFLHKQQQMHSFFRTSQINQALQQHALYQLEVERCYDVLRGAVL